ncbi:hypothetical protein HK28_07875 [Acetobacter sp. DsW_063]|nr:hypothetical protein HK28_07875 [Acetobacter sp. DsW_063]
MIAKIHVARKQLALDEDAYRDVLARVTNRSSCKDMSRGQLHDVLAEMQRLGFRVQAGASRPLSAKPGVRKVYAIWREMAPMLRSEGSDEALRAFVQRVAQVSAPEFLDDTTAPKVIEALKAWRQRLAGGSA